MTISSTDINLLTDNIPSTDIPHPLSIQSKINISSMVINQSMDIPSPTYIIDQTLIGLREGSAFVSEGHVCSLIKGEEESERILTSPGDAKGEFESST